MASKDSNLSRGGAEQPSGPTKQHHRMATGDNVTGRANPNGAPSDTSSKLAGNTKNY